MDLHSPLTPAVILDLARVRRNAERMRARARTLGVRLRPHVKTHKSIEVARLQLGAQSGPITVSTLAEGRAFADHGFTDMLYAVPIDPGKFDAALSLAERCGRLGVLTDSPDVPAPLDVAARAAGQALDVYVKIDCGYHRCGVDPASEAVEAIARAIADASHLRFAGLLTHAGHSYHAYTPEARLAVARQERDVMAGCAARLREGGIPVPTVSVGSTPSITAVDHLEGVDEIRPGNYVFFDGFQAAIGSCEASDCALTVLAAVVHRDRGRRQVVLDAGALALSKDRGPVDLDPTCGYGRVLDLEGRDLGVVVSSVSQEHGVVAPVEEALVDRLPVGTRVRVLVNHSCLAAAQHPHYYILEGGHIAGQWQIHRGW